MAGTPGKTFGTPAPGCWSAVACKAAGRLVMSCRNGIAGEGPAQSASGVDKEVRASLGRGVSSDLRFVGLWYMGLEEICLDVGRFPNFHSCYSYL